MCNDNVHVCAVCGEERPPEQLVEVVLSDGNIAYVCDHCPDRRVWWECERCHKKHLWSYFNGGVSNTYVYGDDGEYLYCFGCARLEAFQCCECGCYYRYANGDPYTNARGDLFCRDCWETSDSGHGLLHEYGWTPSLSFFDADGESGYENQYETPYLGVELETDSYDGNQNSYLIDLDAIDGFSNRFWCTEDSSLDYGGDLGVEITSHPMTLDAFLRGRWIEKIADAAHFNDYLSHDAGTCGLHVHINRAFFSKNITVQDAGGYKLMRLFQRFEQQFTLFSRRDDNYWCRYNTYSDYSPKKVGGKIVDTHRDFMQKVREMRYETDHSQVVNFQHEATFEIRAFRGTLNIQTFYATLALVNGLAHLCKKKGSRYVETVSWYDLMDDVLEACDNYIARNYLLGYLNEHELRNTTPKIK